MRHVRAQCVAAALFFSLSACGKNAEPQLAGRFSGENAFAHVQALVDFGSRPSGSEALKLSRKYLEEQLAKFGWVVTRQAFTDQTPRGPVEFVNLIAHFPGGKESGVRSLVVSHYDTKIFDTIRFVGANDGGSSTGALLELARVLAMRPALARKTELVFFDGEEAVSSFTDTDGLYGSRHFAQQLGNRAHEFKFAVLWDMIGDKNLGVTLPEDSPPALAAGILEAAQALGCRENFSYYKGSIYDDHAPLNAVQIPAIDLIDFEYPPWHTAGDTLDKISAESLRKVGAVTVLFLERELEH